jgi:hypothetical protein
LVVGVVAVVELRYGTTTTTQKERVEGARGDCGDVEEE